MVDAGCWPGAQLELSVATPTCGLTICHGLPYSMAARFQEQISQETKVEVNVIFIHQSWKSHSVTSSILLVQAVTKDLSRFMRRDHSYATHCGACHGHTIRRAYKMGFGGHLWKISSATHP